MKTFYRMLYVYLILRQRGCWRRDALINAWRWRNDEIWASRIGR
jgi:hypothetical protein